MPQPKAAKLDERGPLRTLGVSASQLFSSPLEGYGLAFFPSVINEGRSIPSMLMLCYNASLSIIRKRRA
jgi:hypothetical protein